MTSQSNNARISLNKISTNILSEQNKDIANFTSGHLNESHLWKPPEQKTHKQWTTSNISPKKNSNLTTAPSIFANSRNKISKESLNEISKPPTNTMFFDVSLSELKSPNLFEHKKSNENELKLPAINNKMANFPITNKEMALKFLNSPFKGATKEEKFKNLIEFETNVLKKTDLIVNNILHGNYMIYTIKKMLINCKTRIRLLLGLIFNALNDAFYRSHNI